MSPQAPNPARGVCTWATLSSGMSRGGRRRGPPGEFASQCECLRLVAALASTPDWRLPASAVAFGARRRLESVRQPGGPGSRSPGTATLQGTLVVRDSNVIGLCRHRRHFIDILHEPGISVSLAFGPPGSASGVAVAPRSRCSTFTWAGFSRWREPAGV